jgi:hypothetical protein
VQTQIIFALKSVVILSNIVVNYLQVDGNVRRAF